MIGLGAMGMGMARNIADAGLLTAVYNRTLSKAQQIAIELEVLYCDSPQLLATQVDIILLCVTDDTAVLQMVTAIAEALKPGSIVIDLSTVSNATALKAKSILQKNQLDFLDAPVSGGVEGANKGTLAMMVGGDEPVLEKARVVLETMSRQIIYMGKTGSGQSTKAVNQIMAAGINQAVTEALAFAQAQDLDMEKLIQIILAGAASNWFLEHRGTSMTQGVFKAGFKLALHHKDLTICQAMGKQNNSIIEGVDKTLSDYQTLIDQGFGDEDISALYRLKNKAFRPC